MARLSKKTSSARYLLNGLILLLPLLFIYQAFNPTFPDSLPAIEVGNFTLTAMPLDEDAPYQHDGFYVKDFLVMFQNGRVSDVRQAFVNIGEQPLSLEEAQQQELGILHGTAHGQHVHGLAQHTIGAADKVWITLQTWDGTVYQGAWQVPGYLISDV